MDKMDQYIRQRLQNSVAHVEPPRYGRLRLYQAVRDLSLRPKKAWFQSAFDFIDFVEYCDDDALPGHTAWSIGFSMQANGIGFYKLI
jgi:hypothetical protein